MKAAEVCLLGYLEARWRERELKELQRSRCAQRFRQGSMMQCRRVVSMQASPDNASEVICAGKVDGQGRARFTECLARKSDEAIAQEEGEPRR